MITAFETAGWHVTGRLWVPGDRRPSLAESLVLSSASENLLEADGTLQLTFTPDHPNAVPPVVEAGARSGDLFEDLGGVRYRRLVPRWIIGGIAFLIGLILIFAMSSSFNGGAGPLGAATTPDPAGICPPGYAPTQEYDAQGSLVNETCQRFP
jgi:hypothetical protein